MRNNSSDALLDINNDSTPAKEKSIANQNIHSIIRSYVQYPINHGGAFNLAAASIAVYLLFKYFSIFPSPCI